MFNIFQAPHSIILLDELEKAHGDVLSLLLQVLDDGILTDGKGRTVNFKNAIIIMTSNIGSKKIIDIAKDWDDKVDEKKSNSWDDPGSLDTTNIISKLQSDPKAASMIMNAATDGDMLNALRSLKDSTPEEFDELVRRNPKMKDFLENILTVLDPPSNKSSRGILLNSVDEDFPDIGTNELYRKLFITVKSELEATLKPEFLNRIDEIVVFSQLAKADLISITRSLLQRTIQRAKQERNIALKVSDDSLSQFLKIGLAESSLYGARPLRRAIQRMFEDPVSEAIIKGFLRDGEDQALVEITASHGEDTFTVKITKSDGSIYLSNVEVDITSSIEDATAVNGASPNEMEAATSSQE